MVRPALFVAAVALSACAGGDTTTAPTVSVAATPATPATPDATVPPLTMVAPSASVVPVGFDRVPIRVTTADGTVCELCVWRAATPAERSQGLMGVTDLGDADGMVFVYEAPVTNRYWMRDTLLSLDIAWFDQGGVLVSTASMTPCLTGPTDACPRYGADAAYTLALEVTAGQLAERGIGPGSVAELGVGSGCDTG